MALFKWPGLRYDFKGINHLGSNLLTLPKDVEKDFCTRHKRDKRDASVSFHSRHDLLHLDQLQQGNTRAKFRIAIFESNNLLEIYGTYFCAHSAKLAKIPSWHLYHNIVQTRFKTGCCRSGDGIFQLRQRFSKCQFCGDVGQRVASGFGSQS